MKTTVLDVQGMAAESGNAVAQERMKKLFETAKAAGEVDDDDYGSFKLRIQEKLQGDEIGTDVAELLQSAGQMGPGGVVGVGVMGKKVRARAVKGALPKAIRGAFGKFVGEDFEKQLQGFQKPEDILKALQSEVKGTSGSVEGLLSSMAGGSKKEQALASSVQALQRGEAGAGEQVMKAIGPLSVEDLYSKKSAYQAQGDEAKRLEREGAAGRTGEEEFGEVVREKFGPASDNLLLAAKLFAKDNITTETIVKGMMDKMYD